MRIDSRPQRRGWDKNVELQARRSWGARRLRLAALTACLPLLACFDFTPPVQESLLLSFLPDGGLRVRLIVKLHHPEGRRASSNLGRRVRQMEQELLAGWDPWSRRFGDAGAAIESFHWEKEEGRLIYLERNLVLDSPEELTGVLADTPIHATYAVEDGVAELALYPGVPDRASRRERREVERAVEGWIGLVADYFRALEQLYRYLDTRPQRAIPCFGSLFENSEQYGELTAEEELLLEQIGDATSGLLEVLDVDDERAHSLEELSRKVYDPFPAWFEIELPSPALEAEGFLPLDETWTVPGLSLWSALELLDLTPDPLAAWVAQERTAPDEPFDVAGFAARERSLRSFKESEIRDALHDALTPADVYRVTWRVIVEPSA